VRRLLRILLNVATALSLLLCILTVVLWVRSYWYFTIVDRMTARYEGRAVALFNGEVALREPYHYKWPRGWYFFDERRDFDEGRMYSVMVFPGIWRGSRPGVDQWVSIDMAYPFGAFAALPLVRLARFWRRRRRVRSGGCPDCGYDLRATPDRCPECGRRAEDGIRA
jgi:hypothetical protein